MTYSDENQIRIESIRAAALRLRAALEECQDLLGITFEGFPSGSCGDVVPLLGRYFIDLGLGEFQ